MNVRFYLSIVESLPQAPKCFSHELIYRIPPTAALCEILLRDTLFIIAKNTKIPLSIALIFSFVKSFS